MSGGGGVYFGLDVDDTSPIDFNYAYVQLRPIFFFEHRLVVCHSLQADPNRRQAILLQKDWIKFYL